MTKEEFNALADMVDESCQVFEAVSKEVNSIEEGVGIADLVYRQNHLLQSIGLMLSTSITLQLQALKTTVTE